MTMFSLLTLLLPEGRIPINVAGDEVETRGAPPSIWEKLMELWLYCLFVQSMAQHSKPQVSKSRVTHHSCLLKVGSSAKTRRGPIIRAGAQWQGGKMGQCRLTKAGGGPGGKQNRAGKRGPKKAPTDGCNFVCPF